jgi:hypothetical protein
MLRADRHVFGFPQTKQEDGKRIACNAADLPLKSLPPDHPSIRLTWAATTHHLGGETLPVRANLGLYTQPIPFVGLPVAAVPVWTAGERLPIGVQGIGPPWREDLVLRVAAAPIAPGFE